MKFKKLLLIASAIGAMALLNGCVSSGAYLSAAPRQPGAINSNGPLASGKDVAIVDFRTRMVGDVLSATVTLQNTSYTNSSKNIEYKFTWFDKDGFPTGGDTPWQPLSLSSGNPQQILGVAPNTLAVTGKINIHIVG